MLAPLAPAELIYERLQEPSSESPILYRERAYVVDSLQTDDDLEEHLEAELSHIRRDWRHRDASQFVQLSLFDHRFQGEPSLPPIATLSWKDWQGKSEIWVRGVRRSTLPPNIPLSVPPGVEPAWSTPPSRPSATGVDTGWLEPDAILEPGERDDAEELELIELGAEELASVVPASETRTPIDALRDAVPSPSPDTPSAAPEVGDAADRAPDSGPAWQSPDRSGEYLIPLPDEAAAAPSSQRVPAGDELMDALFERMHELSSVLTIAAATDYVLSMLGDHIPCDGVVILGLDAARDELVVMRASGPRGRELIGQRVPLDVPRGAALRTGDTLELGPGVLSRDPSVWRSMGIAPAHALVTPLQRPGRLLGVIELCRSAEQGPFSPGQQEALELVCQQLAELIGDRPLDLARASLLPKP